MKNQFFKKIKLAALVVCAPFAASANPIEEIVVSGDFRGAKPMDIASSLSVINSDRIEQRNAQHIEDILNLAPNVNFAAGASRGRFVQIRGVGERSQFKDPLDPSVGLLVDGIDFSGIGLAGSVFDAQQVELLRGPHGTRFGANALAGLVNIKSNDPTEITEGSLTITAGNYGLTNAAGVISGALTEQLLGRLSVQQHKSDGYIEDGFLGRDNTGNLDELSLRGKLRWLVSDDLTLDFTAFYLDADNGYDGFSLQNNRKTLSDDPGHDRQESTAVSVKLAWDVNRDFVLESTFFIETSNLETGFDWDWSHLASAGIRGRENNVRDRESAALDLRLISKTKAKLLGNADWVVGIYAYDREVDLDYADSWEDSFGVFPSTFSSRYEVSRRALYGELEWSLTDNLLLTIGGRTEGYDNEYSDSAGLSEKPDESLWGGRVSLEYLLVGDQRLYATLARGYKMGGVNGQAVGAVIANPGIDPAIADFLNQRSSFDSETLINYEIGFKAAYLENSLHLNASLFFMDRQDMQANAWVLFPPAEWRSYIDNVDEGENYGAEVELNWRVTENLQLTASLGYLETELGELTVQDIDTGLPLDQKGREQAHAPQHQFNFGVNYTFLEHYFINLQVEGKDEFFFSNSHDISSDSYELVHLTLGYTRDNLKLSLWSRNLFDEDYPVRGFYFGNNPLNGWVNEPYYQFGEPLIVGVTGKYSF